MTSDPCEDVGEPGLGINVVELGAEYASAEGRLVRPTLIGRMAAATSLESGSLS